MNNENTKQTKQNKFLASKVLRFFAFVFGYITLIAFVMDRRLDSMWGILFAASVTIALASIYNDKRPDAVTRIIARIDYSFLLLSFFCAGLVWTSSLFRWAWYSRSEEFVFISTVAYVIGFVFAASTIIHIRDKDFNKMFCVLTFFRQYPLNTLAGACVSVALACIAVAIFIIMGFTMYNDFVAVLFLPLPFIFLAAIIYLCAFITNMSAMYEQTVEEKLKSERLKIELLTNVSHDIRTPLTSIINYVDLIKKLELDNDTLSEYVSVLERKSARLKTLINDLMDASKAGAGDISVNMSEFDLCELVGEAAGDFDEGFAAAGLTFVFNAPDEKTTISSDGTHLFRIMENIFANAAKYSLEGTRVYCDIVRDGSNVTLSLKNISADALNITADELTERFVRGDQSRSDEEGSGLGLYIAKNLASVIGAKFDVIINGDLFEIVMKLKCLSTHNFTAKTP